jgi:periplasmic protein TonB
MARPGDLQMTPLIVAAVLVAGAPVAAERDTTSVIDAMTPDWLRAPSAEDVRRYHPDLAARQGIGGRAVLDCVLGPRGEMASCAVVSESPAGMGFGQSALKISKFYKVRLQSGPNPMGQGSHLRIPIRFPAPSLP